LCHSSADAYQAPGGKLVARLFIVKDPDDRRTAHAHYNASHSEDLTQGNDRSMTSNDGLTHFAADRVQLLVEHDL
jgi:hypothetical protein